MPTQTNNNARVDAAIAYARAQIGKPYVYGTAGPNSFDCSGLVWKSFAIGAGYNFTGRPTTYTLVGMGTGIDKASIQPGDLVFPDAGHVQIYTGNGMIIEAPHTGAFVQEVKEWGAYWKIRRLISNNLSESGTASGTDTTVGTVGGSQTDSTLGAVDNVLHTVTDASFWLRVLYIIAGIILILIALGRMGGSDVITIAKKVSG